MQAAVTAGTVENRKEVTGNQEQNGSVLESQIPDDVETHHNDETGQDF